MPGATRKHEKEKFESLMRRFKRAVEKDGVLQELRKREHFEKPSAIRKRAKTAAKKRHQRLVQAEKEALNPKSWKNRSRNK